MKKFSIGIFIGLLIGLLSSPGFAIADNIIKIFIDDKEIYPDVPPQIINGRVFLPARFITESLGATIHWDVNNNAVVITGATNSTTDNDIQSISNSNTNKQKSDEYTLNKSFIFDNLEIKLGSNVQWDKIDNHYSKQNGATVFKIPMAVKNIGIENNKLSSLNYSQFGSKGVEQENIEAHFDDSGLYSAQLRPNASQNIFMYFLYDGDGDYYVRFNNNIEIKIPVKRTSTTPIQSSISQSTQSQAKMYTKHPDIPDFGELANTKSIVTTEDSYAYQFNTFEPEKITEYGDLLRSLGFVPVDSFESPYETTIIVFYNGKNNVFLGSLWSNFIITILPD